MINFEDRLEKIRNATVFMRICVYGLPIVLFFNLLMTFGAPFDIIIGNAILWLLSMTTAYYFECARHSQRQPLNIKIKR